MRSMAIVTVLLALSSEAAAQEGWCWSTETAIFRGETQTSFQVDVVSGKARPLRRRGLPRETVGASRRGYARR